MESVAPYSLPQSLSPLQASILGAIARYSYTQARPVTVRDLYRRLRLEKNLTLETIRELKDMGLLNVTNIVAGNKRRVMTLHITEAGQEWILD